MKGFLNTPICRLASWVLVFLMVIQMPLSDISQAYQYKYKPDRIHKAIHWIENLLAPAAAEAAEPVADAGGDRSLNKNQPLGSGAILDGSGSFDPDGNPLTYQWRGPFSTSSGMSPSVKIPEGIYTVSLIVNDGTSNSKVDTAAITIMPCFNLSARAKPGKVQLTWTNQVGTERYDIYRAHESNPFNFVKIGQTTSTYSTYLDETVLNEATYLYVVGAFSQGVWCYSDIVSSHPTASRTISNYSPVIYSSPITHGTVSIVYNYDVQATDPNQDLLSYNLISAPSGMSINPATGLISWIPASAGSFDALIEVSDSRGKSAGQNLTIRVEEIIIPNRAPTADAGPDQTVFVSQTVQLDGSNSSDPNGDSLTYKWSFVSAPVGSAAGLSDPTIVNPSFLVDVPGTYVLQLIVNDGKVDSALDTVTITTGNSPPVADAGPDQTVFVGDTVTLDGSRSSDVDGDLLTFRWSFVSIPPGSTASLSDITAVEPTFLVDRPITYVVQLIVNDGKVDSAPDTVSISTENRRPVANAGSDQTVFAGDTVTLDGSGSSDVDGDLLTFQWSFVSRPAGSTATISDPTSVKPTFMVDLPGTYVAQLIVNDGKVDSAPDTVSISTENRRPVANAGSDQTVFAGDTVTLDGSGSSDVDGDLLTFQWSFVSRPAGSTATISDPTSVKPTFVVDKPGTYVAQLIVNDGKLDSAPATVTISTENSKPVANAGPDQEVFVGETISLDGSGSTDADGDPLTYRWSFTSRPAGSGTALSNPNDVNPSFSVDVGGTYVVQLIVNDGKVDSDPDTVTITTKNSAPIVNAGSDQTITLPNTATLNGSVTDDGLPLGGILTITWSKVSGPGTVTFGNPNAAVTTASFSQAGTYVLRLTANDSALSSSDDVQITVKPANQAPVVNAGPDQTITLPNTATLNGPVTDDGLPSGILTINWSKVSGPGTVTFSNPNTAVTTASFSQAGTYVLRLTANDSQLSNSDDIQITVNPQPVADYIRPEATVTVSPSSVNVGGSVTITVSATDSMGVVSKSLTVNGSPVLLDATGMATYTSAVAGVFTAVGKALDAAGNEGSDSEEFRFLSPGDLTVPTVAINSPADNSKLSVPTDIIGTASDANLTSFKLDYSVKDKNEFITFASRTSSVTNGVLGKLDPTTMRNGLYDIKLTAEDASGNKSSVTRTYQLDGEMKVGNFTVSFNDLTIPVTGIPITIIRTYDSRMKTKGDFGIGWTLSLKGIELSESGVMGGNWQQTSSGGWFPTYTLKETKPHYITVTFPDGRTDEFTMAVNPSSQQLAPLQVTTASFVAKSGTLSSLIGLDVSPIDLWIQPYIGNVNLLDWDTIEPYNPNRYQLTDVDSTIYIINQQTGLESIKDTNGNTLTFGPGGIIHSAGKSVTFTRDAQGRIITITDPMGTTIKYAYDYYGDLISVTDQEGNTTRFTYNSSHGLVDIIDPRGIRSVRNEYDDEGRLVAHIDANGNRIEYTHNIGTRQEIVKDRLGNITVFEYDNKGQVVSKTDPLGNRTGYTYDANGNKLSETDPMGTTTWTYDGKNNKLTETKTINGQNVTTRSTYNSMGKVLTTTDPMGRVTTNTYNTAGNLLTTRDPLGNVTTNTYDAGGNLISITNSLGNKTTYQYDGYGNRTKQTDPLGKVTTYTYDANGNKLTETDPRGGVTRYTYDSKNRQTSIQDPLVNITHTEYDLAGNVSAREDALGNLTTFVYNTSNKLIQTNYPDGTFTQVGYDAEGNRTSTTDQQGRTTHYQYNANKQLIRTTYPDSTTQDYGYDAAGRQTSVTDALGNTTTRVYDSLGRVIRTTDPEGNITSFEYDLTGNQTKMTDANGNITTFVYDANNRQTQTILPGGQTTTITYDGLGRKIAETDAAGNITQFGYDAKGNLIAVTDALGGITQYECDANGNQTTIIDARGNRTTFAYDLGNRLVSKTMPNGGIETYAYDAAGRQTAKTDALNRTIQYTYDTRGRLTTRTYPDTISVRFSYMSTGRRSSAVDLRGTTSYFYDNRDRLTQMTYPDGQPISYTYDQKGQLKSISSLAGTVIYNYSSCCGRLQSVTDPYGDITSYSHDPAGNRTGLAYPNGTSVAYTYDTNNRLTQLTHKNTISQVLASYTYTLGPTGNRTRIDESNGIVRQYTYDALYRLTREQVTDPTNIETYTNNYTYDAVGNRLTKTGTNYTYNNADQLITENDITYTYDLNGNLATKTDSAGITTYTYDYDNHLIRVTTPSATITYKYDTDGNRVEQTSSSGTTRYLVDTNRELSQVLAEYTPAGTIVASYVYADDLISMTRGGQTYYYHFDGLGSTRMLTDSTGTVTDTYDYDAFGNLIAGSGTTENPFLFTGQQYDANNGFYYLRARYYQPTTGRFTALDPFEGDPYAPMSLHKYLYAGDDPVNKVDPSGEQFDLGSFMVAFAIIDILSSIATPSFAGVINKFKKYVEVGSRFFYPVPIIIKGIPLYHCFLRFNENNADTLSFDNEGVHKDPAASKNSGIINFIYHIEYADVEPRGIDKNDCARKEMGQCKNYHFTDFNCCDCAKQSLSNCGLQKVGPWPNFGI